MLSLNESRSDKYIVSIELSSLNEGSQRVALTTPVRRKMNYWMTMQCLDIGLYVVKWGLVFATRHQSRDVLVSFVNFGAGRSIK